MIHHKIRKVVAVMVMPNQTFVRVPTGFDRPKIIKVAAVILMPNQTIVRVPTGFAKP